MPHYHLGVGYIKLIIQSAQPMHMQQIQVAGTTVLSREGTLTWRSWGPCRLAPQWGQRSYQKQVWRLVLRYNGKSYWNRTRTRNSFPILQLELRRGSVLAATNRTSSWNHAGTTCYQQPNIPTWSTNICRMSWCRAKLRTSLIGHKQIIIFT